MKIQSKCKDCTDRYPGCHSSCEDYKEYRDKVDTRNQQRRDYYAKENEFMAISAERKTKRIRKKK